MLSVKMAEVCVNIPEELIKQAKESNIDLSKLFKELLKRELIKQKLIEQFNSKEEQDLIKWSVDLGRRAKKGSFKKLLSELSPKRREELLNSMPPEKREEYK